jgi:hypothetical protein
VIWNATFNDLCDNLRHNCNISVNRSLYA